MPLVKNAKITDDLFVHTPDGAELPGDGAILVSPNDGGSAKGRRVVAVAEGGRL